MTTTMAVNPAPHEFGGNLVFDRQGLSPFYALDRRVKDLDGGTRTRMEYDGRNWIVSLGYQKSGLKPREDPDFDLRTVREFNISVKEDASPRERKANFQVAPRWPDMESKGDGANPSTPEDLVGVNVKAQGANLSVEMYPELLRAAADALDLNPDYFRGIHDYSNIYAFEQYVRIERDESDKVVGMNGPLRRIFEYVSDYGDFRELYEDDTEIQGFLNRVTVDSTGANALMDGHNLAKKLKHYHPREVKDDPDNPLYHPKIGVSFAQKRNASGTVAWADRDDLTRELRDLLLNVLSWAGINLNHRRGPWVEDAYFKTEKVDLPVDILEDPTPEIRREQDAVVIGEVTANPDLTESDLAVLEVLTDGSREVDEVAEETAYSKRTVYRVLDRLSDLLENERGRVTFASEYLADGVRSALADAREALEKDGATQGDDPWAAWRNTYGVDVEDPEDDRLILRFGRVRDRVDEVIRSGLRAWVKSGRDRRRFELGKVAWKDPEGTPNVRVPISP